ncbi:unnamed protein product [Urochloa decumbens]|uniref:F-box domain-containing protein n=1 Tax=Urochloa decumbens TaxID=240449 RepID=A0ABC9H9C3_9POAL
MALPRPPPDLVEDAISEILLRLRPEEPRDLFRASLVCKPWRRLLTDAAFLHRYRCFHRHRIPPLLGFFFESDDGSGPRFTPATSSSPLPQPLLECRLGLPLDCRHSRVLLRKGENYVVWDPIYGDLQELPAPHGPFHTSVAVLCDAAGCDHRDCHGGPFLVVWVGNGFAEDLAYALVYSSRVGSWGSAVSLDVGFDDAISPSRAAVVGDQVCFMLKMSARILKYDLAKHHLSVISPPNLYWEGISLVPTEDGLIGIAAIRDFSLYLWPRKANAEGVEEWKQYRVIELHSVLPPVDNHFTYGLVIGFAEGVRVIIMSTDDGVFLIDLTSGRARKISSFTIPAVSS